MRQRVVIRLYLAGPMSGYEEWNYPAFDTHARWLRGRGYGVVSPAERSRDRGFDERAPHGAFTSDDYRKSMIHNYRALLTCDGVALLPGWEKSTGALLERRLAMQAGLAIFYVDASREYLERELVVGIGGYARAGKDTLANLMVEHMGFQRRAFADSLRNVLYATNPIIDGTGSGLRLADVVDRIGWDQAKVEYPEVRSLMQRLGTEGGRRHISTDIWSRTLFESLHSAPRLVIPDCRFPDEAADIHRRGGYVLLIERDGVGPVNDHVSELCDISPDVIITNNGDPLDMVEQVRDFLGGT